MYLYILWLCMLLIEDVFTVLNAVFTVLNAWTNRNDVLKSRGMIVIMLTH